MEWPYPEINDHKKVAVFSKKDGNVNQPVARASVSKTQRTTYLSLMQQASAMAQRAKKIRLFN
ncbi:MAG TPA: hypothetical protein VLS96_01555 [Nodosilinea sp.]|nr:hypothetical protein [Nodosilinea sp.]